MTVRVYSWDDVGAPELIMTNPSGNTSFGLERLKQILKACLVDGYGDKEPAGWSMGHEVEGGFSLFNGDNYFAFTYEGSNSWIGVYTLDDIADGSSAIPEGPNRRSGYRSETYPSNIPMHLTTNSGFFSYSFRHVPRWVVIADQHTAYILHSGYSITIPPSSFSISNSERNAISLGRALNALNEPMGVFGGGGIVNTQATSQPWSSDQGNFWFSSHNPSNGSTDLGSDPMLSPQNPYILSTNTISFSVSPFITLFPMALSWWRGNTEETSAMRAIPAGRLRGVFGIYPINGVRWDIAHKILTGNDLEDFWDQPMRPINLGGKQYFMSGNWQSSRAELVFISLDENDWI